MVTVELIAGEGQERREEGLAEGLPASVDGRQPSDIGLGLRTVTLGRVQEEEQWVYEGLLGELKP